MTAAAAPGATFLLFGFAEGAMRLAPHGVSREELRRRLPGWNLLDATRGTDRMETWWYRLERGQTHQPEMEAS